MKNKNGEYPGGDKGQIIFFCLFLTVWTIDSIFHISTFLSEYSPFYLRLAILLISLITAVYLFASSHFITRQKDKLITSGVFEYTRHPLYLSTVLVYLGLTIYSMSVFSIILFNAIFMFYDYIAGYEEKILEEKFGEEYIKYKEKTGKWVIGIDKGSNKKE